MKECREGTERNVPLSLKSLYNTVVLKDIVARKNISDVMMLESVLRFSTDNIGSIFSTNEISDTMTTDGRSINVRLVDIGLRNTLISDNTLR